MYLSSCSRDEERVSRRGDEIRYTDEERIWGGDTIPYILFVRHYLEARGVMVTI